MSLDPITAIEHDWPIHKQIAVQSLFQSAYASVTELCDPKRSPVFTTPNQRLHSGYTRWIAVNYWLERGCNSGLLEGISPVWKPVFENQDKSCSILELHGKFTSTVACHISEIEASPRESRTRRDYRAGNQKNFGFLESAVDVESPLLNLILVHGDKNAEFAFLRGYYDPDNAGVFTDLSGNIMDLPTIMPAVDEEPIDDPDADIKDHLRDEEEDEEGQNE